MAVFEYSSRYVAEVVYEPGYPGNFGGQAKSMDEALEKEMGYLVVSKWPDLISIRIKFGEK